jgi:DtxR family Mn-dependent transcriptional regulator
MSHSSTVENYLKTIFQLQTNLPDRAALVPMGQLAGALGVAPGTATTMVKALAESGLVRYEPYAGVRLAAAGERLAALVLRRHRLIELFLVQVMRMSWAEVHEEAEQLEHAVSDRLIDRIDEMLGSPSVDPHGDPIPDAQGTVPPREYHSLLSCPLRTPVRVTRVVDQDAAFLRFIEHHELKPGETIEVETRDAAADSVSVRGRGSRRITLGTRAASKLLVEAALALLVLLATGAGAAAQQRAEPPSDAARPFEIMDNSFLVEEAFNQEHGVFQNIVGIMRMAGDWEAMFTQEWPVGGRTHQFSYSVPLASLAGEHGVGDIFLNYRYQALVEGPGRPAFAPRLSIILPTGSERRGLGNGVVGWQVNLPFSKQRGDVYVHWNAGFTLLPGVRHIEHTASATLFSPYAAASAIWRARPMLNVMLETVLESTEDVIGAGATARAGTLTVAPGVRGGWNLGSRQLILGFAVPVAREEAATHVGAFGYVSYELPFLRKP